MQQLMENARGLMLDPSYVLTTIGIGACSVLLLRCAEAWGSARARRRTARAIADIGPPGPPEART